MKHINIWLFSCYIIILIFVSCKGQSTDTEHQHTNKLIESSSPYLLQHAHNPVDWYPWGDEALEKAKKENKLLIISVGYAACHWCHVMEHESFEDSTVAAIMNENYVSIKVDREERPDIDQIYMNAAYMTSGRGGWPLNAIALPDGRPIFAATYFPKEEWMRVINHFGNYYKENPEKLEEAATNVTEGIQGLEWSEFSNENHTFSPSDLDSVFLTAFQQMDLKLGGFDKAPKFPMPAVYQFLLRYHYLKDNQDALQATLSTLDQMANGGIYDQLGGGFSRYSTDVLWKVPHFEKMLYDNAQLVSLYSEAYQLTKDEKYKQVVFETLDYVKREMTDPSGGFYSSLDADSDGEEGKFYVWEKEEIDDLLGDDALIFSDYFNIKSEGNWEEKNILYVTQTKEEVASSHDISVEELDELIQRSKETLFEARNNRVRPGLDDKTLTSWNALMLKGYVDAYRVFGEEEFLQTALKNANFLKENMIQEDYRLNRNYKDGKSSINGFLDDYSLLIEAYVALYQATFDEQWLNEADQLMQYALEHFKDEESQLFFYTSKEDAPLITRSKQIPDTEIPGANSSLAKGLFLLGTYLYNDEYLETSQSMLKSVLKNVKETGRGFPNWGILLAHFSYEPYEIAIVGDNWAEIRQQFDQQYLPDALFLGGNEEGDLELLENKKIEGQTMIYVCQNKSCKLPQREVAQALKMMTR